MADKTDGRAQGPEEIAEGIAELHARAATYAFLSRALSDEELPAGFLSALAADAPHTGTDLDAYAASLTDLDAAALEVARRDLAADHAACLLGMSARPVSAYESVYTSEEHLMRQDAWERARAAYTQAGYSAAATLRVPEDHIAVELRFCAMLLDRAADYAAAGVPDLAARDAQAQAAFVRDHLAVWAPRFCDLLEARASTAFYRGVAQMLRAFVEQEAKGE